MGTKVPGYERSQEQKELSFSGNVPFVLGNESSRERKFSRTKGSGNESSGNFRSWLTKVLHRDLSFLGTKGLGYEKSVIQSDVVDAAAVCEQCMREMCVRA